MTDRRIDRTRKAIRTGFMTLLAERRYEAISVADIAAQADIGKSTFYEHFRSKDDLLNAMMEGMLDELATSVTCRCDSKRLSGLIDHFWSNRRLGKIVFGAPLGHPVRRRLASLMEKHLAGSSDCQSAPKVLRAKAAHLAAGHIGLLHAWLSGELSADRDAIVDVLCAQSRERQAG